MRQVERDMVSPRFRMAKFSFVLWSMPLLLLIIHSSNLNCYSQEKPQSSWSVKFNGMGLFSSPRVADFNSDGVGDIVLGAGREEFKPCDTAVIAINGVDGSMLWKVANIDHV